MNASSSSKMLWSIFSRKVFGFRGFGFFFILFWFLLLRAVTKLCTSLQLVSCSVVLWFKAVTSAKLFPTLALCELSQHLSFRGKFWNVSSLLLLHLRLTIRPNLCISYLRRLCLNREDNILKLLSFLISSGIARVCVIELYKLVSNRKGSKVCMLAVNFPFAVEYCPMFLSCGFQDYRVSNEAFVQVVV